MSKYKFQVGGQDEGSTDFFNTLLDTYQQQLDQQNQSDSSQEDTTDTESQDNQNSDYEDLLAKYQELETRLNDYTNGVQPQQPDVHDYGDSFLNFLFSDEGNNEPIDWSNVSRTNVPAPSTGSNNSGFRTFNSPEEGRNALENQLKLYQTGRTKNPVKPNSTLLEAMSVYAPASDNNNPVKYSEFIAKKLGISSLTPISQIDTKQWANAITQMEGNKTGNNPGNLRRQYGGKYKVALTDDEQSEGLNDNEYDEMEFPMQGLNQFRGLDSKQAVFLQDELGNSQVLINPLQMANMFGKVKEKRLI